MRVDRDLRTSWKPTAALVLTGLGIAALIASSYAAPRFDAASLALGNIPAQAPRAVRLAMGPGSQQQGSGSGVSGASSAVESASGAAPWTREIPSAAQAAETFDTVAGSR